MAVHIVEDDPGVLDSLALVLRDMGHDAVMHPDAESLFERTPPGPADTVIVDLALPGIGGVALIRWLSRLTRPPRVIAISGQPANLIEREMRGLDVPAFLRKPLSRETLAAAL